MKELASIRSMLVRLVCWHPVGQCGLHQSSPGFSILSSRIFGWGLGRGSWAFGSISRISGISSISAYFRRNERYQNRNLTTICLVPVANPDWYVSAILAKMGRNRQLSSILFLRLFYPKSQSLGFTFTMTVVVPEPKLEESNITSKELVRDYENNGSLDLDGGFVIPDNNAFGHSFRDYEKESGRKATIEEFYRTNHINQTYEFARKKKEEYGKLERAEMSIWECCELLNECIDESDPDLDEPQIEHLLQTAEAIRRDYPHQDWLHLTALIHDLGKVLLHPSFGEEPQWCVVGDTFPLGCAFDESIVHHQYFKENPDFQDPLLSTKLGSYSENCGLDRVTMSWGHDEYMYLVAKENKTTLPPAGLFIIRFHSFYAMHRSGAYTYLMNDEDKEMLKWLQIFNKYDLYSKSKVRINQDVVKPYYLSLIDKYFPPKLRW